MKCKVCLLFIFIFQINLLSADEHKISPNINFEHTIFKQKDITSKIDDLKLRLDTELSYKKVKVVASPIWEHNLTNGDDEYRFRKVYIAYLPQENIYLSAGKQPIIWGVGRGKNPTNYIKELNFLEKQQKPDLLDEGVDSLMLTLSHQDLAFENIVSYAKFLKDANAYVGRLRGLFYNWDISISFYRNLDNKKTKLGFDFEGEIANSFNLYSEIAFDKGSKDYSGLLGISKQLSERYNTTIDIEYDKSSAGEEIIFAQINSLPNEEFNGLFITSYDLATKQVYLLPRLSFYRIKNTEMTFGPTFVLGEEKPFDYLIIGGVTYWWK